MQPVSRGGARGGAPRAPGRSAYPSRDSAGRSGPARDQRPARTVDPRREERRRLTQVAVPPGVEARELDPEVRAELRSLAKDRADLVAQHLVMVGRLIDEDPEQALAHARAAGALGGRVGAVREALGLAAYAAGAWADALSELRTARRITGRAEHLAVMADAERALGRPERALALLDDPDVGTLEQTARVELVIVVAGARRDLGQPDAAVLLLQGPARATTPRRPWAARLWYAYADALLGAGRPDEAREWFARAAEQDAQGETDAEERLLALDGVVFEDLHEDADEQDPDQPAEVDLTALLSAPVPPRPAEPAEPDRPSDEPSIGSHDTGGATQGATTGSSRTAATSGASAATPRSTPERGEKTPTTGPTFSDEDRRPEAERRAGRAPAVTFAPPPELDDEPADDD